MDFQKKTGKMKLRRKRSWQDLKKKKKKKKSFVRPRYEFAVKNQNGPLKKTEFFKNANSQIFFAKISWIGPWVCRIDWCERHWCGLTYMAVRLFDASSNQAKNAFFVFLGCFWAYVRQPHDHTFFFSFPLKSVQIYMVEWIGRNFNVFPGFQKIPCYA